jgi:hypothetical protein
MEYQKPNNQNLRWEALEFKTHERTNFWYIGFAVIAIALIAYAIFTHNLLTTLTFIVLAAVWLIYSLQTPRIAEHELSPAGIRINRSLFPYKNIKKFWIIYSNENKTLNFETTAYLNNRISLQLGNQNPTAIKQFLKTYLPEDLNMEESLTDVLARKIKF